MSTNEKRPTNLKLDSEFVDAWESIFEMAGDLLLSIILVPKALWSAWTLFRVDALGGQVCKFHPVSCLRLVTRFVAACKLQAIYLFHSGQPGYQAQTGESFSCQYINPQHHPRTQMGRKSNHSTSTIVLLFKANNLPVVRQLADGQVRPCIIILVCGRFVVLVLELPRIVVVGSKRPIEQ